MLGIHDLWLFIVSGFVLTVAPGPDLAYIVARSAQFGWRGGATATFGISTGCLVHLLSCAIGLSALLAASATAFTLVKWAGAAYLCFIGIKMLLTRLGWHSTMVATGDPAQTDLLPELSGLAQVADKLDGVHIARLGDQDLSHERHHRRGLWTARVCRHTLV